LVIFSAVTREHERISRRRFIRDAGATATAASLYATPALARRRRATRRRVAVLGGGMAGLAAAHELIERGFDVTVYERSALGGKARSIPVSGTARGGRRPLPGEHGFRFFPGFYHHVPDTMRRIPVPGNQHGVHDNMLAATGGVWLRTGGRPDATLFGAIPNPPEVLSVDGLLRIIVQEATGQGLSPIEGTFFATRLLAFVTSCDARRFGEWEYTSWWDFVRADSMSAEYQKVLARGLTSNVVAGKAQLASTRTIGYIGEAFVMNVLGRGNDGAPDRVLNAPTNEAWIDPWVALLKRLGVRFRVGQTIDRLEVRGGAVARARARDRRGHAHWVDADWFVCAMPVERARRLWSRDVLAADPSLAAMNELFVDWMVGIQFYLRRPLDITPGHIDFVDSAWALTALTQAQFWNHRSFARDYGDGAAVDCLSVDISDWNSPGIVYFKPAKQCTPDEIRHEVWAQIRAHLINRDRPPNSLPDDILHSWFLDPGIAWSRARQSNTNETPLLVNTVGSWPHRPQTTTQLRNLFLAGDYVQTNVDLATMEGANESGRAAVNALLERSGSAAEPVKMYKLYRPPEFDGLKQLDEQRYRSGLPNLLYT
jgi:uncharacterized protein with NAD-binding domain and iron-sulfur cluster